MKLAEGEIIREDFGGDYPIFLFDDVLSELDARRRSYLLSNLDSKQVIMTSCEKKDVQADRVIGVENGNFTEIEE